MASEVLFVEGGNEFLDDPAKLVNSRFRLSPKPIAYDLSAPVFGDLYSGSDFNTLGEIAPWTGLTAYQRITVPTPNPVNKIIEYLNLLWQVGSAIDGPTDVRSLCLEDPATSKAIFAWDLRPAVSTLLNGSHTLPTDPINVDSTAGFKAAGGLVMNGRLLTYTGITATTFTGITTSGSGVIPDNSVVMQDRLDLSGPNFAQISLPVVRLFAQNPGGT